MFSRGQMGMWGCLIAGLKAALQSAPARTTATLGSLALALSIAVPLVQGFEGRHLKAYLDPLGIPTICDGRAYGVSIDDVATPEQCDAMIREDLERAAKMVEAESAVPLAPETLAAFSSFVYNVGPGRKGVKDGFLVLKSGRSSTMRLKLNTGDVQGACNELPKWNNPKHLRGLTIRRQKELELCLSGL